jgi:hypothetical protein
VIAANVVLQEPPDESVDSCVVLGARDLRLAHRVCGHADLGKGRPVGSNGRLVDENHGQLTSTATGRPVIAGVNVAFDFFSLVKRAIENAFTNLNWL